MLKKLFLLTLLGSFLIGCANLTESQLKAVNDYSEATDKYSDYPSAVVKGYIDIQHEIVVLRSALKSDPETAADFLYSNIEEKRQSEKKCRKIGS
ncbi:MAG: hypothetical protein GQ574_23965 [Crocinitomix sp.]|nr:hypothetical protein [Crocinitomix sp.]